MVYVIVCADKWKGVNFSASVERREKEKKPSWLQLQMVAIFPSWINECNSCNAYYIIQQQNSHIQFTDKKYFN